MASVATFTPPSFVPVSTVQDHTALGRAARVLSGVDAVRYTQIFRAQDQAQWGLADDLIAALRDRSLMGAVLAQRYLTAGYLTAGSPAASSDQLAEWLTLYGDQPEASDIAALAKGGAGLRSPSVLVPPNGEQGQASFADGTKRPHDFSAGLDSWRQGRWADAAGHFETMAATASLSGWYRAAGAFWAARAHLKLNDIDPVERWYRMAADHPQTFYGQLAREMLGLVPRNDGTSLGLTAREVARVAAVPGGRRALALLQIGQTGRAEVELMRVAPSASAELSEAIVTLADVAHLPALCLALGNETMHDRQAQQALYPLPSWRPKRGFSVDRALLFALMMEESRFKVAAQSESGAYGLMQLMPATAREVARDAGVQLRNASDLNDPELNLSLGQEYVKRLIGNDQVNGSLILLLAAYTTGPGPLQKWLASAPKDDPLLFIEMLPRLDTRLYVQRVLTNLWIYRQRLGEPTPDLVTLAADGWPSYVSLEQPEPAGSDMGKFDDVAAR